jgi:NhaA family Na+:H+ antiporter
MKRLIPLVIVFVVGFAIVGSGSNTEPTNQNGHVLGPADAAVTLDEFGDFECPPCGKLSEPINQMVRDFSPRLRVVFHHCPLTEHKYAREAAHAAEAAGLQGKFWEMHDMLYRDQDVWANSSDARSLFSVYAMYTGLNVQRFKIDMDSDEVKARIDVDVKKAISLGIRTTPTLFINNKQVDPKNAHPDELRAAIEAALKNAKPSS